MSLNEECHCVFVPPRSANIYLVPGFKTPKVSEVASSLANFKY